MGLWDWLRGEPETPPSGVPPAPTEADVVNSLDRVTTALRDAKASPLIGSRVARIDRLVRSTLPRLADLGLGSADAYAVVATATSYLPEAVAGYLRLPRDWADTRPIDAGRTALMVLVDQLELLGGTMAKVLDAANRSDAQALIAHGRFLEAKFGAPTGGAGLDLGSGAPAPSPSPDQAAPTTGGMNPPQAAPRPSPQSAPPPPPSTNSLDLE